MVKKKVYIISHSHWDREWYLPYEQHHMRLVALMDDLLEMFQTNPDFHSFHLDGQTIALDDYLEVRPDKEGEVRQAIAAGKLKIGPFYILQDDFLISAESNTRNMLIGLEESRKWGEPVMLGYFPDTFGNMGQAPQMMKEGGIEVAAFGRGVKPTGFNNAVINDDKYASQYSEMWWQGADGAEIFSLLFANWYSNGNEIPVEIEAAKAFWETKLADAEQYASTKHLLMMNGCDHQPLQKDVTEAIKVANELYPDYEFVHSSFEEYITAVQADVPADLSTVSGELTSQETDGWYTLANTSSARIYLKQKNTEVQRQLENITEPLATMAAEVSGKYPHDELRYAWKLLLQNHPHDSICGCSVDEVHQEMMTRFAKSLEVGKFLATEALETLTNAIDTSSFPADSKPFVVFNTSGSPMTDVIETEIEWERLPFSSGRPDALYKELQAKDVPDLRVITAAGETVPAEIVSSEVRFNYDLPKDGFRVPYMARYVKVRLAVSAMPEMSWQGFALATGTAASTKTGLLAQQGHLLENEFLKVVIASDGRLEVTDKLNDRTYPNFLTFENVGDIANEYIFKMPENDVPIYAHQFPATVEVLTDSPYQAAVALRQTVMIPVSADEAVLNEEMKSVTEFRHRKAGRSQELAPLVLETVIRLDHNSRQLKFTTNFDNQMKNHRLRVLFPTAIDASTHYAESIYEVVERPNDVSPSWENPTNPQHQHSFVNIHDEAGGVTVSNYGINEYELVKEDATIALTIFRATGELGDWGYFETPEAQCFGPQSVAYAVEFHGQEAPFETYKAGQNFQIPLAVAQTGIHDGSLAVAKQFVAIQAPNYLVTTLKRKEHGQEIVLRGYNLSNTTPGSLDLEIPGYTATRGTLIEELSEKPLTNELAPAEIHTTIWHKK